MFRDFGNMDNFKPAKDWRQIIIDPIGYAFNGHTTNTSLPAECRDGLAFHVDVNGLTGG